MILVYKLFPAIANAKSSAAEFTRPWHIPVPRDLLRARLLQTRKTTSFVEGMLQGVISWGGTDMS